MESHHSVEGCSGLPVLKINVLVSATERKRSRAIASRAKRDGAVPRG
jgi:hypothetical protein